MTLPPGWRDTGAALVGPMAPDGHTYFFSDSSGMRALALTLLGLGVLSADDAPIENASTITLSRIEQCTLYSLLVIARDAAGNWHGSRSNLGSEHLKASGRVPHVLPLPEPITPPSPPSRRLLPALARLGHGLSEFAAGFNGTCTQTALTICIAAQANQEPLGSRMVAYTQDMVARGWAAGNGATTLASIARYAREVLGQRITTEWDYQEPLPQGWLGLLTTYAGIAPILMQVAQGANLIDAETGIRDEAAARGLRYHAIAIVGTQGADFLCCDGDHPQVTERFQVYSRATLTAAVPCGLMMLAMP